MVTELLALAEQEVKAEADPENRLADLDRPQERLDESTIPKLRDPVAKRSHPWQDDAGGVTERPRVVHDLGVGPNALEPLLGASKVRDPGIDDGNHGRFAPSSMF
jgi:hypothetical protein